MGRYHGATNVSFCIGDTQGNRDLEECSRGIFVTRPSGNQAQDEGKASYGMGGASDGTSNTIAISESRRPTGAQDIAMNNGVDGSPIGQDMPTLRAFWSGREYRDPNTQNTGNDKACSMRGYRWISGEPQVMTFSTVFPPNSGNFMNGNDYDGARWVLGSASSNHSGGVNACRMDGSVSFITDSVNTGAETTPTRKLPLTDNGTVNSAANKNAISSLPSASMWGVWGALGTKAGRENVTL
jgi:prepilin-type processing-associated H-X9-DG protein